MGTILSARPVRFHRVVAALLFVAITVVMFAPSAAAAALSAGDTAEVRGTGGLGLRVRYGPSLEYKVQTVMPDGKTVKVLSGPVWKNGYPWYKITGYSSSGSTGWSAGKWLYKVSSATTTAATRPTTATTAAPAARTTAPAATTAAPATTPSVGPSYSIVATGYNGAEFGSAGYMANGEYVHWGAVAVDPRYIPLGTRMYISGFGNQVFIAKDTGSAIKGWRIDIWFPSVSQAQQFGVQSRTVTIIR